MNVELFIAKKISNFKGGGRNARSVRPIIRIALASIAIGIAVMIIALSIVRGFQTEIRNKVIGFGGHIQVSNYNFSTTGEVAPINEDKDFVASITELPEVNSAQVFARKPGILKTKTEIQGIVVKGVGEDFTWDFFEKNIKAGRTPNFKTEKKSNELLVSKNIADKLELDTGQSVIIYFIQNEKPRPRKFNIVGIYESGLAQFDEIYVIGDIRHIQRLNQWDASEVEGYEILFSKYEDLERAPEIAQSYISSELYAVSIVEQFPEIFGWLNLLDMNVVVILLFAILVASINMVSALLILILNRTQMIGMLKAMGASDWQVRKVFVWSGARLIGIGLFWGNLAAFAFCWLQMEFGFLTLPQESYYLSQVPIEFQWGSILAINAGTLLLCSIVLIIPSYYVTKISPVRAIRFD